MDVSDELLDRFLDGDTSNEESEAVLHWLEADQNMRRFAERSEIHADLRRSLHRRNVQQEALAVCSDDASPDLSEYGDKPIRRHDGRRTFAFVAATLATAALLASVLFGPGNSFDRSNSTASIATVAYQSNAGWSDQQRSVGDPIGRGIVQLDVGIARLDFANGASVTLQGSARFEVLSNNRTRLHHGILTAQIPEAAIGFEVQTPAMDVVDLGTAFGVSVGTDGETGVCVFEGEVEVNLAGRDAVQLVREGNAVRSRPSGSVIKSVAYETNRYEGAWPVTSGVLQATGLMKFVSPGPEFVPGRFEDNERILVFLERSGVVPQTEFFVDLVDPGQYQRIHRSEQHAIAAGGRIRSYLLQLDPVGRLERNAINKPRVIGQVTFDRPVIGLIASSKKLSATDDLLGHPGGDYVKTRRGIEPPRADNASDSGRDVVILSVDRRTLSLDLSAGTAVDQIRVVVDELN
ncbi:MAG: FecR domain-containing protein [Fuerstiella sp.]